MIQIRSVLFMPLITALGLGFAACAPKESPKVEPVKIPETKVEMVEVTEYRSPGLVHINSPFPAKEIQKTVLVEAVRHSNKPSSAASTDHQKILEFHEIPDILSENSPHQSWLNLGCDDESLLKQLPLDSTEPHIEIKNGFRHIKADLILICGSQDVTDIAEISSQKLVLKNATLTAFGDALASFSITSARIHLLGENTIHLGSSVLSEASYMGRGLLLITSHLPGPGQLKILVYEPQIKTKRLKIH